MTDYVVAVGFETDANTVKRSTDDLAGSVEKVGKAQTGAVRSAKDLATAQSQLERLQTKMTIQQQRLGEATERVQRMQARGATNTKVYTAALEKQLQAQDALARSVITAERIQTKATAAPAKSAVGSRIAATAAGFITGQVLTKFTLDSIKQADDLRGTLEQNQRIFGASAGEVVKLGQNSATSLGLSRQAAISAADGFGQLFHTLKVGQGEAAQMSTGLVKVGVDLAAFEKVDPTQLFDALKGGLSGQFDGLQRYGVYLNTATVRQEAMRLGLVHGKQALSQSAQAAATYSLILKQASDRQGTFANGADEVARKQAVVQAKLADAKAQFGQSLIPTYLALADAGQHLIPILTGVGKALGFIVEHDTTRKIAEILALMYAINKVVQVGRAGVDRLSAAYARLAVSAGEAAAAERGAAASAVTPGGPPTATRAGLGLGGPAALAITTGLTLAASAQGPEQALLDDGKVRGGRLGKAEEVAGQILQGSNALTIVGHAWSVFKAKAKETDANVSDTTPVTHLTGAMAQAQARVDTLADQQVRLGRSLRYAITAQHDARALAASAAQQPIGGIFDALKTDDVDLTGLQENVRSAQQAVALARGRQAGGSGASAAQIASAEASVASARAAARRPGGDFDAEQARLRAAELRLTELRQGGNRTAQQSATAEKGLADARERLRKANKDLQDGEEKVNGLSLRSVLDRADASKGNAEAQVRNVRTLVKSGLTADVIEDLKKLETTAPGTLANVAKALTPAFVRQLNHDAAARRKAAQDLASLGGQAVHNDAVRRARQLADDQAKAYQDRLLLDLKNPGFRAQLLSALGQLLTPGLPGGPKPPATGGPPRLEDILPPGGGGGATPTPSTASGRTITASYALPTQPSTSGTIALSTESVSQVASALAVMSPRQTTVQNTITAYDYDAAMRQAADAEALSRLGAA